MQFSPNNHENESKPEQERRKRGKGEASLKFRGKIRAAVLIETYNMSKPTVTLEN